MRLVILIYFVDTRWQQHSMHVHTNLRERDHWGDPGVDVRIILRWIFKKWYVGLWNGLGWFRIETGGGHL
jgi:hypothetical protein